MGELEPIAVVVGNCQALEQALVDLLKFWRGLIPSGRPAGGEERADRVGARSLRGVDPSLPPLLLRHDGARAPAGTRSAGGQRELAGA